MASRTTRRPARRPGRLPQRVYWYRRSVVLVVAALLVFGTGKLLGGLGSDGSPAEASTVAGTPSPSASASASATRGPLGPVAGEKLKPGATSAPLLPPSGVCPDDAVSVLPSVPVAQAGKPIVIHLRLVGTQPACTFAVSPASLAVKITSGSDRIWSSQDCPRAVPRTQVVVRSGVPTDVPLTWSGRRSDEECSNAPAWAMPGYYHVFAAALGSSPTDVQFEVTYPSRGVVTKTAKPKPAKKASSKPAPTVKPVPTRAPKPSPSPSKKGGGSVCGGDNAAGSC